MNTFQFLIHKKTGKCIDYEEWLDKENDNELIKWEDKNRNRIWQYNSKDVLSNNDFGVIYNPNFTKEQLETLFSVCIEYFEECGHPETIDNFIKKLNREKIV